MNRWLTADPHFGHKGILKYCNRPFDSVEEMDEILIGNWNSLVAPKGDIIYVIGDFIMGGPDEADRYFKRLFGQIKVVPGGHDRRWLKQKKPFHSLSGYEVEILPPLYTLQTTIKNEKVIAVMCHYSMRVWDRSHYGSYMFFGHSHGRLDGYGKSCDVGVDSWGYCPVSLKAAMTYIDCKQEG